MTSSRSTVKRRVGLIGANGRLGREIILLAPCCPNISIAHSFCRNFPLSPECKVDVLIDVSSPEALHNHLHIALSTQTPIVVGTTGHKTLQPLQEAASYLPIFYAPNFSIGMALMKKWVQLCARFLPDISHAQLKETHHTEKKDRPSGSAKMLAATLQETLPSLPLQIESERRSHVVGIHELQLCTNEEILSITHEAKSRAPFAIGALTAASFLVQQPPGFYTMENLLTL